MRITAKLKSGLRNLFHKDQREGELSAEVQAHLDLLTQEHIRAGMAPDEARRSAYIELGGEEQVKEHVRDASVGAWLQLLLLDLRYAVRMLRKNAGFTTVAVLTLALGIGASTTIFSIVNTVLLKPLGAGDPSRLVLVMEEWRGAPSNTSPGIFSDLRRQAASFATLSASTVASFNLETNGAPERVDGEQITRGYFETFGVAPIAGRVFTPDEDTPEAPHVVVVSESLWRTRLHADPQAAGQSLILNRLPYTVVGIMPKEFDPLLSKSALWVPMAYTPQQLANRDAHYLRLVGRLKPGIQLAAAQAEISGISERLQQLHPLDDKERFLRATELSTTLLGDERLTLRLLLASVGFLLLIACANIANLQLARATARRREIAVRAALGATAKRIVRQLLVENVVLAVASGIVGVFFAYWTVSWIAKNGPNGVPRLDQATVDGTVLAFACAIALLSSLLFGLVPALRSASTQLTEAFKATGGMGVAKDRVRSALVIGEVALALVLMTGAGLLIHSALLVSHLQPGFDTANLIVGRVGLPDVGYSDPVVARQTFERMADAVRSLPGVQSAAIVSRAPLTAGFNGNGLIPEGKPLEESSIVLAMSQIVSPTYLSTVRVPLKAGRNFTADDTRQKTMVTIINETLARTMWPGQQPIGKRFACCEPGPKGDRDPVWHEVIGVVGDVHAQGLDRSVQSTFYLPMAQMPATAWGWLGRSVDLVVRTRSGVFPLNDLRAAVASVAPGVPIYQLSTMQEKIAGTLEESHFDTFLLSTFAGMALLLSSIGIYGVLSYVVSQRTREIGMRLALGAEPAMVLRMVLKQGLSLALIGAVIGLVTSFAVTRIMRNMLYGIAPSDPATFAIVVVVLVSVALAAAYLPARRAMRVDPMVALRYE